METKTYKCPICKKYKLVKSKFHEMCLADDCLYIEKLEKGLK